MVAKADEERHEEKQSGLEKVLTYFPDASLYQFGLFLYCYYGYMGVATALAGNIFYQYTPKFECNMYNDSVVIHAHAFNNLTDKEARCEYYQQSSCSETQLYNMSYDEVTNCFAGAEKTECTSFVYNDQLFNETLVKDYDLVCAKQNVPKMFIMLFNVGMTLGPIVAGKLSDILGRTRAIALGAIGAVVLNMIIGFFDCGVWGYGILRIFIVIFSLILALPSMVYPSEILTPKYRSIGAMLIVATALGAGVLVVTFVAYFIRDWRTLHIVVSLVNVPSALAPFIMPESYRWLYQKGKYDEAEAALMKLSDKSGGTVDSVILAEIREEFDSKKTEKTDEESAVAEGIGDNPIIKKCTFILTLAQFTRGLVQFHLLYTVASLGGDFWTNNIINNAIGFPAAALMIYMMNLQKFGRRGTFAFGLFCVAASQGLRLLSIIIENTATAMVSSYLGLFGAMGAMAVGQAFTAELFPTSLRIKATGIIYTGAMGGSFVVPFWMIIDSKVPWITACINFGLMVVCGLMAMQLPETLGKPMTETIADFEKAYLSNTAESAELKVELMSGRDDGNMETDKNANLMKDLPETDI